MSSPLRTASLLSTCCLAGIAAGASPSLGQPEVPLAPASQPKQPLSPATPTPPSKPATPITLPDADHGPYATAVLLSESAALVPGAVSMLAVQFTIAPDWHTYWNGRSDTGFPFKAEWVLPAGFEIAGPLQWPAPKRYISPGDILDHVYEDSVSILVPVRVPASAQTGDKVTISAQLTWLVCKSACVFENGDVSVTLPIAAAGSVPAPSGDAGAFATARARLPVPIESAGAAVSARIADSHLLIEAAGTERLEFYPLAKSVPTPFILKDGAADRQRLSVSLGESTDAEGNPRRVQGVIMLRMAGKPATASDAATPARTSYFSIDLPMPDSNTQP